MIFVTVGTQLPFERLIVTVDAWAADHPDAPVYAQIGPGCKLTPTHVEHAEFVSPDRADQLFRQARVIVSHAGMGSILTALKYRKPIIIMPRRADLGEHRNDHQWATAEYLGKSPGVSVAWSEHELVAALNRYQSMQGGTGISEYASPELIAYLKTFIGSETEL
ncbi:glycosyltransferase [Methylomonas methanica]|uniref:Glycosyltransferase 28 domain protein n=1 Tax=Methylomonas methanica (strain DSM 25384 / MC09) TaxID=857087 RepID=G0A3G8_METMM|nr:glycosyltransferase [Methylomonas methanica]AEG00267.1 Glycosyltransferase 28 domain protein [Methylomonas methanica MC09]